MVRGIRIFFMDLPLDIKSSVLYFCMIRGFRVVDKLAVTCKQMKAFCEYELRALQVIRSQWKEFLSVCANGYLNKLLYITLCNHNIGDSGMIAFSEALRSGAFAQLEALDISMNGIGNDGITAFSVSVYDTMSLRICIVWISATIRSVTTA